MAFISSRGLDPEEMEEDEDEEEDDDDDDFDFSTAGIKSKLPGKRIVEMKVFMTRVERFVSRYIAKAIYCIVWKHQKILRY